MTGYAKQDAVAVRAILLQPNVKVGAALSGQRNPKIFRFHWPDVLLYIGRRVQPEALVEQSRGIVHAEIATARPLFVKLVEVGIELNLF